MSGEKYQPFLYDYMLIMQHDYVVGAKIGGQFVGESFITEKEERLTQLREAVESAGLSWVILQEMAMENINKADTAAA